MNDYDDSEDYTSANSFRARSNTWPLNRPDLAVPNSVCIDETLPEIELEEDDLFTTNENWSMSLVDHDIMSWDPILNAHSQTNTNATSITNQHQQHQHVDSPGDLQHHHQQHHLQHHHQQQQVTTHQRPQQIHHPQQQSDQQQQHELINCASTILGAQQAEHQHQLPPHHHQTLNNTQHCLDNDDPNEYHIHQMHQLRLDNNQVTPDNPARYNHITSSMCIQGSTITLANESYISSSDHHIQPLTSARYDLEQSGDLDLKGSHDDHPLQHHHHQQLHHLTSSSLDHQTSHMLSSSLSTSGIGLSGDLEDLDFKSVDPSAILQNAQFEELQHQAGADNNPDGNKQTTSTTSSKTKLNTPRRNAWGNMSYADLISQAINSTNDKRLTLSQIYDWMVQHVPYFKDKGDSNSSAGWKNSVRHNLSLHNRFKRLQNEGAGKSSWWTINPEANVGKCARRRAASMEASKYEKKRGRAKKRAEAIRQGLVSYSSLTNSSLNGSASTLDQQQQPHLQSPSQFAPQSKQQQQQTDGLSYDNLHNRQPNAGLYVTSSQKPQYEQEDDKLQQQIQQHQQSHTPPTTTSPLQQVTQQPQKTQQQPSNNQVQQVHHQMQKMETYETDSYYIQQQHHDLQHDQNHHQNQQFLNSSDHKDLFGRHAIYMSEPCNDCNCTELLNCGTNAMSFT